MSGIKFGVEVPYSPDSTITKSVFVDKTLRFLGELEGTFDSFWVMDHFRPGAEWKDKTSDVWECFTTMSYLAGLYKRIGIGSFVLCNNFRNPALLAKMGATLGTFANGRFILGLGAGWVKSEFHDYGYKFPQVSVRVEQLEEAVQIIRKLWTEETTTFHGKHYDISKAYCYPKPDPMPPIMIGGKGDRILRLVARHANWWNTVNCPLEVFKSKLKLLKDLCGREDRNIDEICITYGTNVAISETVDTAQKIIRKYGLPKDDTNFIGPPETIIDRIEAFIDLGVKYFIFGFVDAPQLNGIRIFNKKVLPKFAP